MNTRIIKEARSLLPAFCVMVLASIAPRLFWNRDVAAGAGLAIFTICCLMMGASCFGNEYQWRTMPLLLAQPVSRRRIWNEKMLVLGSALGLGFMLFLACVPLSDRDAQMFLILIPPCIFCVAPYMALTAKNTIIAAVLTFGLPFGLGGTLALLGWIFAWFFPGTEEWIRHICTLGFDDLRGFSPDAARWVAASDPSYLVCLPVAIYCFVCYRLGYRSFIKLQAVDEQAKEIALPAFLEAALARPMKRLLPGYTGPWASLFRKELQIQKPAFLVAGAMCVGSVAAALAWHLNHSGVLEGLDAAAIAILVFIMPFLTTGISVAEERAWGVSAWQLALPARARQQWAAKMLTVIFTSVLLGVALPALLWILDGWVFHLPIGPGPWRGGSFNTPTLPEVLWGTMVIADFVLGYLLVLGLGVFTSSQCANSAKAIIMNIGLIILGGGLMAAIISGINGAFEHQAAVRVTNTWMDPYSAPLILGGYLIGLVAIVQGIAFSNYRQGEPGSNRAWKQLALVLVSFAGGALLLCNLF